MKTMPYRCRSRVKLRILAVGLSFVCLPACGQDQQVAGSDAGSFTLELILAAIAVVGDFIRALLAAFLH